MLVAETGEHAAPRRAAQEAALQQVGLVDLLDGVRLLAYGVGQRGQPHRAAIVLLEDDGEDLPVHPVQTFLVHLEQVQGLARHLRRDAALVAHLGEIPHAFEQPVGYARRPARAQGYLAPPLLLDDHVQDVGGTVHDHQQLLHRVVVQPMGEAEPVPQRRGDEARPRGGSYQSEVRQFQADAAGAGSLTQDDVDLEILHRRVEDLLDRPVEPVDLVDEQHVSELQVGEDGGHVRLALQGRPGRGHDVDAHLRRDDVGQRGLAQSRRAGEQHVVQRLPARERRLDEDLELLAQHRLPDEGVQ